MGVLNWFDRENVKHYLIRYRGENTQGWEDPPIDDKDFPDPTDLEEPIPEREAQRAAELQNWPPGRYQLTGRLDTGGFTDSVWTFDVEPEGDEEEQSEELTPEERREAMLEEVLRELRDGGGGRISEPGEAYGRVFEAMMSGQEMPAENITALRTFLKEWQSVEQGPPSEPGEFAGRLAQQRFESGDTEGAVRLLDGWFQAEQPADAGGLLAKALDGNVDLGGEVGLLELAGIDAYTRMEPALDKIADSLGGQAVDAVAGDDTDNLLAKALAEGSGRTGGKEPAAPADAPEPEPEPPDDDGPSHSPDDVAEISAGFGSDTSSSTSVDVDDQDEPADALELESVMGPTISTDEAADVAAQVGGGS